jgi:hypothetical protein
VGVFVVLHPEQRKGGPAGNEAELEEEDGVEHVVHLAHDVRNLLRWLLLVHHDLGLVADIDGNTIAVRCVLQGAAAEQQILDVARSNP